MAQRIFRSDDTSKWVEGYGNGSFGDVAPTSTSTDDQANAAVTGSNNTNTLNYSSLSGSLANGDILFIVQAHGTGALTEPNYELNRIASFDGSTITTKYKLTRDWNSGAQVYVLRQHRNWTLDGGATINVRAFDGTIGGFFIRLAKNEIYIDEGTIAGQGLGFNGGNREESGSSPALARAGASPSSNSNPQQTSANGPGGGGARDGGGGSGATGGGAGNAQAGNNGVATSSQTAGTGGNQISKTQLKIITLGPGGGGGIGPGGNDQGGIGGDGGTTVILIARRITITSNASINIAGENGNTDGSPGGSQGGGAGGGAAGDFLAKGEYVDIGTGKVNNAGGVGGNSNAGFGSGGNGSYGYGHVDYAKTVSGSLAAGSLTTRQDKSLIRRPRGAAVLAGFLAA